MRNFTIGLNGESNMANGIGKRIHDLRTKAGMTQTQLAETLSVTFQAVSKWEKGKAMPDIDSLPMLSDIFGVSIDYLVTGKEFEKPHKSSSHWAVTYMNKLIAPIGLSSFGEKELIKTIEGYDEEFVKECMETAYDSYVKDNDPNIRKRQVATMLKKLGGVLYNESLGPVQKTINKMLRAISARSGDRDKKALNALKKSINELLAYQCGDDATEDTLLKALNSINEIYLVPSNSVWGCHYKINDYMDSERRKRQIERDRLEAEKATARLRKRVEDGFFETKDWPKEVSQYLIRANEMIKVGDPKGLMANMYNATAEAIRLMIIAMPESERPSPEECQELKNYSDKVYGWFGRSIGKHDANYIKVIAGFIDDEIDIDLVKTYGDLFEFESFMKRLYRKYKTIVRKGRIRKK